MTFLFLQVIYIKSSCVRQKLWCYTYNKPLMLNTYVGSFNAAVISTSATLLHFCGFSILGRHLLEIRCFPKVPIKKLQVARFRSYLVFLAFSESFKYFVKSKRQVTFLPSCISTSNFMRFKL